MSYSIHTCLFVLKYIYFDSIGFQDINPSLTQERRIAEPFRRVRAEHVRVDERFANNSFDAKVTCYFCWQGWQAKAMHGSTPGPEELLA